MGDGYTSTDGMESENAWKRCVMWDKCGYIGVKPNSDTCPECRSGFERYGGNLYCCDGCGVEYVVKDEAISCC